MTHILQSDTIQGPLEYPKSEVPHGDYLVGDGRCQRCRTLDVSRFGLVRHEVKTHPLTMLIVPRNGARQGGMEGIDTPDSMQDVA